MKFVLIHFNFFGLFVKFVIISAQFYEIPQPEIKIRAHRPTPTEERRYKQKNGMQSKKMHAVSVVVYVVAIQQTQR